jgi:acyl-CoA synthetase (NDP forming)
MYAKAARLMLSDKNIDSLIVILGPPLMLDTLEIAHSICDAVKESDKTVMLVLMSQDDIIPKLKDIITIYPPIFRFPEDAARVIAKMYEYKKWREHPEGKYIKFDTKKDTVRKILRKYHSKPGIYLEFDDVYRILHAYGMPLVNSYTAIDTDGVAQAAAKLKYPVVIKAAGKNLVHKSDIGGVEIDIHTEVELKKAIGRISENLKTKKLTEEFEKFIIQPYIAGGIETILGITKDEKAGHMIMFGLGGIFVEIFKDVNFKLLPINDEEAMRMIRSIKSYKMLTGVRGRKSVNIDFIKENLLRLSQLSEDFPVFKEIDLNPFVFFDEEEKCRILDARIRLC